MSTSEPTWFTSSCSGGSGDDCVEVAVSWRTSGHSSGREGDCVDVAACPGTVHVRYPKDPDGPHLAFSPDARRASTAFPATH